ncbi:MAG TPA: zinc ribbon domain-containing protein [Candidatus Binatia bacterium]|nr:zinc ribbon domain-containing protein [Candidatus Binatia bacterium]
MPIYDYICSECSTTTEFIHGIDAPSPRFCPACGTEGTLRKAFVPPAVHFKGSGWAKKDRAGNSGTKTKAAAASDGKVDGTSDGKADSGGDSKSAAGAGSGAGSSGGSTAASTASEG